MKRVINLIDFINKINDSLFEDSKVKEENNVSELHAHKILFIIYGSFYEKFNKELFEPNFRAWKYGPVELDYREYKKKDCKKDVIKKFDFILESEEEEFLKKIITRLLKFSPWSLVEYTHSLSAWKKNHKDDDSENIISKDDIFQSFKDRKFE